MGSRPPRRRRCGAVNAVLTTDRFRKRQLGIALGERSLSVAEAVSTGGGARGSGGAMRVERCAEFAYPSGLTLERGEELGNALAQFLKSKGFSTRRAILPRSSFSRGTTSDCRRLFSRAPGTG